MCQWYKQAQRQVHDVEFSKGLLARASRPFAHFRIASTDLLSARAAFASTFNAQDLQKKKQKQTQTQGQRAKASVAQLSATAQRFALNGRSLVS